MLTGRRDYDALLTEADRELLDAAETVAYLHAHGRLHAGILDGLHDTVARRNALRHEYLLQ